MEESDFDRQFFDEYVAIISHRYGLKSIIEKL